DALPILVALHMAIPFLDGFVAVALWIVYAVVATIYVPAQSYVCLSFPEALTGRAFTAFNLLIFVGVFVVQWLFGVIVDLASAGHVADAQGFRRALFAWAPGGFAGRCRLGVGWRRPGGQSTGSGACGGGCRTSPTGSKHERRARRPGRRMTPKSITSRS